MILDGKELAEKIKTEVAREVRDLDFTPCLATVLVGDDPASKLYIQIKEKACREVGIKRFRDSCPQ